MMIGRDEKGHFIKGFSYGPRSEDVKKKISLANSGSKNGMWSGGKPKCKSCGIEIWWGSDYCSKHVNKFWLHTKESINKSSITRKKIYGLDETKHPRWKGKKAGYVSIHKWVRKHLGKPFGCKLCGKKEDRRYEWANMKRILTRDLKDYSSLCVPCHRKYDYIGKVKNVE